MTPLQTLIADLSRTSSEILPREDGSVSTASSSSFAFARLQLHECLQEHPQCRPNEGVSLRVEPPTRLLHVECIDGKLRCRLDLTEQDEQNIQYLTLSHCWGDAKIFKLTGETLDTMRAEIQLNCLPPTFRDAIEITHRLGFEYLWIDSLCIIQDDPADWAYESGTMSRVYSNSVFTIAALWGSNSESGCFIERDPLVTEHCRIGDWIDGGIYVSPGESRRLERIEDVRIAPLYGRAWVLQERLLSRRILCYGPWQLHWVGFPGAPNTLGIFLTLWAMPYG